MRHAEGSLHGEMIDLKKKKGLSTMESGDLSMSASELLKIVKIQFTL